MQYIDWNDIQAMRSKLSDEEYLEILYYNYPSVWIEENLPNPLDEEEDLELRIYQTNIANYRSHKKIIRMGRQLGKSFLLISLILYFGIKRRGSKILVIGPQQTHVDQIFDEMRRFIAIMPALSAEIPIKTKNPNKFIFANNNMVMGLTTGESSGGDGLNVRGKTSNVLFVDEADYINDTTMEKVVIPTTNAFADPFIYVSSTPSGKRGWFRKTWDGGYWATFHHKASEAPNWTPEREAEIRAGCTKRSYILEYDAGWGDLETGLFNKDDLHECAKLSMLPFPNDKTEDKILQRQYTYKDDRITLDPIIKPKYKILGVDWNKAKNGTRLIWCEFDEYHNMYVREKWKIDTQEFTQNVAMSKIIELHADINFDYIMVDIGFGTVQVEDLHLYGIQHPETRLQDIVKGVPTDSHMDITDIATGKKRKTPVKNFLVESMVRYIEQHRVRVPAEENVPEGRKKAAADSHTLLDQMHHMVIEKYTTNGRPVYGSSIGDHDLNAFFFALYGYLVEIIKTPNLWQKARVSRPKVMSYDKIITIRNRKSGNYLPDENPEQEMVIGSTDRKSAHTSTYKNNYNPGSRTIRMSGGRSKYRISKRTINRRIR